MWRLHRGHLQNGDWPTLSQTHVHKYNIVHQCILMQVVVICTVTSFCWLSNFYICVCVEHWAEGGGGVNETRFGGETGTACVCIVSPAYMFTSYFY